MQHWFGAAEAALAVLFRHGAAPEEACAAVVRHIAATALGGESQPLPTASGASPLALARLCFVLGHSALKLLVYSEDLASRLKRAKGGGAKQQQQQQQQVKAAA
jgi:condensin complex subunit 1